MRRHSNRSPAPNQNPQLPTPPRNTVPGTRDFSRVSACPPRPHPNRSSRTLRRRPPRSLASRARRPRPADRHSLSPGHRPPQSTSPKPGLRSRKSLPRRPPGSPQDLLPHRSPANQGPPNAPPRNPGRNRTGRTKRNLRHRLPSRNSNQNGSHRPLRTNRPPLKRLAHRPQPPHNKSMMASRLIPLCRETARKMEFNVPILMASWSGTVTRC